MEENSPWRHDNLIPPFSHHTRSPQGHNCHSTLPVTTQQKKSDKRPDHSRRLFHIFQAEFVLTFFLAQFQIPTISPPLKPPPPPPPSLRLRLRLHPTPIPRRRRGPLSHGKAPASTLPARRARAPVSPRPARRAGARGVLPRRADGRRLLRGRGQHDTPAAQGSRPARRPAPARRGVVHPGRVYGPAEGAAAGAVLRQVRQRRHGLLQHLGERQPQRRLAQRRGGPLPGGALRLAPSQGHPRQANGARRHPLRHRPRQKEPLEVALRGPAGLHPVGRRQDERRRRRRQLEGQARCSWPEVY